MFLSLLLSFILGFLSFSFLSFSKKLHLKCRRITPIYGPSSYPILGCLISFYKNSHRLLDWYTELLSESPTQTILVQRFGAPRTIITANANNVEHILKTNFINYPKGQPFTEILGDFLGMGIFNVDGERWNTQRKLASHEFSTKSLREFVVKTLEEVVETRLIPLLDQAAKSTKVLDLQDVLRRFAFDTICKVSLGTDPHCLDDLSHVPILVEAFDNASQACAMRGMAPIYAVWKSKRALNLGSEKKLKENVKRVHCCISEIIEKKKQKINENGDHKNMDLLSRLLIAGHEDEVVRDMVISFLIAGRDTTSSALTWLFWLTTKHHDVKNEMISEITSINNGDKALEFDDLKEMKYLQACLNESMRLYPPVAWDSKHAAKDDILPDGTRVQKGNRVTYFQYGMGRMEEIWGKDRLEFKPDRWLDENGVSKSVCPYKFPVFQAGPRVCLGKEMAFTQMKYVLASVLRRFEIKPVNVDKPVFVPLLTAHMAGGFNVRIYHRGSG
ncbi:cytochrome P450 94B3-like [Nicotiana tomentosiformis]|uniref:cytochrome P450 94B3-like n=1 Tax=Nicotiana tomentosiformis TaxID=4098 RepID=UPI00051BDB4B|nr:cytochrome P450 94B3-like [Nicotiana tomentosiformis]